MDVLCVDTSDVFIEGLNKIKQKQRQQKKENQSSRLSNLKPFLSSDMIILRDRNSVENLDLYDIQDTSEINEDSDNELENKREGDTLDEGNEDIHKGKRKSKSTRKRGRPKNTDNTRRDVIVDEFTANPTLNTKDVHVYENTKIEKTLDSDSNKLQLQDDTDVKMPEKKKRKTSITVKDPRIVSLSDCIKQYPNFSDINSLDIGTFTLLRQSQKATCCFGDPYSVFMGIPKKSLIKFDSNNGHLDRWPFVNDLADSTNIESTHYKYTKTHNPIALLYNKAYQGEDNPTSNYVKILSNVSQNASNENPVEGNLKNDTSGNNEDYHGTQGNEHTDTDKFKEEEEVHNKDKKGKMKKKKRTYTTKTYGKSKAVQKITNKKPSKQKRDSDLQHENVFLPNSKSAIMVEVTRSVVDDKDNNPAYCANNSMNKHTRGLHDNRFHRLFTKLENTDSLFQHLDKYHIKESKERTEMKKDNVPVYSANKFLRNFGQSLCAKGINEETINSGVDYLPYILGRSNIPFYGVSQEG